VGQFAEKAQGAVGQKWKKVKFSVNLRGVEYEVAVTKDDFSICRK
jgi:hypothetical protein